jgi:hypothetical protein
MQIENDGLKEAAEEWCEIQDGKADPQYLLTLLKKVRDQTLHEMGQYERFHGPGVLTQIG